MSSWSWLFFCLLGLVAKAQMENAESDTDFYPPNAYILFMVESLSSQDTLDAQKSLLKELASNWTHFERVGYFVSGFVDQTKLLGSLNSYEDFSNAVDKTTLSRGQASIDIALRILDSNFPRKNSSIPSYVIYFITANYGLTSSIKNTQGYTERFTKVTFVSLGSDAENLKKIFPNVIEWENWTTSKPKNWERKFLKAVGA